MRKEFFPFAAGILALAELSSESQSSANQNGGIIDDKLLDRAVTCVLNATTGKTVSRIKYENSAKTVREIAIDYNGNEYVAAAPTKYRNEQNILFNSLSLNHNALGKSEYFLDENIDGKIDFYQSGGDRFNRNKDSQRKSNIAEATAQNNYSQVVLGFIDACEENK